MESSNFFLEASNGQANVISFKRLLRPISRCVFLIVVLSVSTGPLIRELIRLSLSDLLAFTVGLLWLSGDIIPCIAVIATLYDIILVGKRDDSYLLVVRGKYVPISDLILILFIALYLFELIIVSTNYLSAKSGYSDLLEGYRYGFFNLQVFVSILYVSKPWAWRQIDIRNIVANLGRFHLLLFKMAKSISVYLRASRSVDGTINDSIEQDIRPEASSLRLNQTSLITSRKTAERGQTYRSSRARQSAKRGKISLSSRARQSVKQRRIPRSMQSRKLVKRGKITRSLQSRRSVETAKTSVSRRAKHTTTLIVKHIVKHE